jgi:dipeptidyl aminopeptidase/acylaminoacyl peptidase
MRFLPSRSICTKTALGLATFLGVVALTAQEPVPETASEATPSTPDASNEESLVPVTEWASAERYYDLFAPLSTERVSLSPDGKHVAFTYYDEGSLSLMIAEAAPPFGLKAAIRVGNDESATPLYIAQGKEVVPLQVVWLGWTTDHRVVFQTNQVVSFSAGLAAGNTGFRGYVYAVNADGSNLTELGNPILLARLNDPRGRPQPAPVQVLDYDPERPGNVIVRAGYEENYDLYSINAENGEKNLLFNEVVSDSNKVLLDRQYRANLVLPNTTLTGFPHHFRYDEPRRFSLIRWKDVEDFVGTEEGRSFDFSLSPENLTGNRSIPLGFDENPNLLYFASDEGRDTFAIYSANLKTRELTEFALEHPLYDLTPAMLHDFSGNRALIYDRYSRALAGLRFEAEYRSAAWINPAWQTHQQKLEASFPNASVDILEWDRDYRKMLVRINGPTDPGHYYLYDAEDGNIVELIPRSEHFDNSQAWTASLRLVASEDRDIPVRLTIPVETIHKPTPLIVLFSDEPWDRLPVDYDREVLAFSRMGYVVAQFSGQGAWGYGKATRQALAENGSKGMADEVARLVQTLKKRFAIHPSSVALVGEGMGGYQALQTLREYGDLFRCGIIINAPLNPDRWIENARWADLSQAEAGEAQLFGGSAYDTDLLNLDQSRWTGASERFFGLPENSASDDSFWDESLQRMDDPMGRGSGAGGATYQSGRFLSTPPNIRYPEAANMQLLKPYLEVDREAGIVSLVEKASEIEKPVLFFAFREEDGNALTPDYNAPFTVARDLRSRGIDSRVVDLHRDYSRGLPQARADVFAEIAGFLNTHMFDYSADPAELEYIPLSQND